MTKRVFFAINLPVNIKESLTKVRESLAKKLQPRKIRWVSKENLHLTLHFLGDKTIEEIANLDKELKKVSALSKKFKLVTGPVGCFPDPRQPRVILVRINDLSGFACELAKNLSLILLNLGMEIDSRPWRSHVTLGRVKDEKGVCDLDIDVALQEFEVKSFELMESQLDGEGSVYKILASYPLSH